MYLTSSVFRKWAPWREVSDKREDVTIGIGNEGRARREGMLPRKRVELRKALTRPGCGHKRKIGFKPTGPVLS